MKMSKSKRLKMAAAARRQCYVVAYVPTDQNEDGTCAFRRAPALYGPRQFQNHLENRLAMAQVEQNPVLSTALTQFLAGDQRYIAVNGAVYENRNSTQPTAPISLVALTEEVRPRHRI